MISHGALIDGELVRSRIRLVIHQKRADAGVTAQAPQQVVARHAKPNAERAATRRPSLEPMVPEAPTPIKDVLPAIAERLGIPS